MSTRGGAVERKEVIKGRNRGKKEENPSPRGKFQQRL